MRFLIFCIRWVIEWINEKEIIYIPYKSNMMGEHRDE